jgi:hypothetical protein
VTDLPEVKRNYQAEVHFALGAVIQGITVAALGGQLAQALRELPFPGAIWVFVTGLQSLLLCIIFWYSFMNNYFFGFRAINLTALTHFLYASLYLVLGLQQLIAIQFLDIPRAWMTLYVLLIATALVGSKIGSRVTVIKQEGVREVLEYDPASWAFIIVFLLAVILLVAWYIVPGIDTDLFRAAALSVSAAGQVVFAVYYVLVFQKALELN